MVLSEKLLLIETYLLEPDYLLLLFLYLAIIFFTSYAKVSTPYLDSDTALPITIFSIVKLCNTTTL
jgi:hypothetical protein